MPLTFAALGVLPLLVGLTVGVALIIRRQLRRQAEASAKVQSHLVETLSGMETVKGQGMELPSEWRWESYTARLKQVSEHNHQHSSRISQSIHGPSWINRHLADHAGARGNLTWANCPSIHRASHQPSAPPSQPLAKLPGNSTALNDSPTLSITERKSKLQEKIFRQFLLCKGASVTRSEFPLCQQWPLATAERQL